MDFTKPLSKLWDWAILPTTIALIVESLSWNFSNSQLRGLAYMFKMDAVNGRFDSSCKALVCVYFATSLH